MVRIHCKLLVAMVAVAGLAGCGGGGHGTDVPPNAQGSELPQSALSSPQAYTSYVDALPPSDTGAALAVSSITPPTSDTIEPQTLL